MAINTCGSLLEQVQQGHRHPQIHHILILTSLLAGDNGGGRRCRGDREGNSPVSEVFTVCLPDLPTLSPQHTRPSFQKKFYTLQHPFLIFKPLTAPVLGNLRPSSCPRFLEAHSWASPASPAHRAARTRLTVFSIFPLARSSAYKGKT